MSVPRKPVVEYSPDYPAYDEGRRNFLLLLGGSATSVLLGGCKEEAPTSKPEPEPEPKLKPEIKPGPGPKPKPEIKPRLKPDLDRPRPLGKMHSPERPKPKDPRKPERPRPKPERPRVMGKMRVPRKRRDGDVLRRDGDVLK